uniref:Methyltransferase n=1 Tax=Parastrongyloides trichosuri TaxID=131310 RepID=A0A0N4ZSM3_PARTI
MLYKYRYVTTEYLYPKEIQDIGKNAIVLDRICSNYFPNTCYSVVDRYFEEEDLVGRSIVMNDDYRFMETFVGLKKPNKDSFFWTSDTRLWEIDHDKIDSEYVAIMASMPFFVHSKNLNYDYNGNFLEIGLGGGSLSMFLHSHFKNLNITVAEIDGSMIEIAKRYFNVSENNKNYRILREDGEKTIEDAVKNGMVYDSITIDACGNDTNVGCPTYNFIKNSTLNNIKKILKDRGIVNINLLVINDKDHLTYFKKVMNQLLTHFPTCIFTFSEIELNYIVGCVKYSIENIYESEILFEENLKNIVDKWNLSKNLYKAKIKIMNKNGLDDV